MAGGARSLPEAIVTQRHSAGTPLTLFLVPVTFAMHAFWSVADPQAAQVQSLMFYKNLALIGASMLIVHFGAGPFSLDAQRERSGRTS